MKNIKSEMPYYLFTIIFSVALCLIVEQVTAKALPDKREVKRIGKAFNKIYIRPYLKSQYREKIKPVFKRKKKIENIKIKAKKQEKVNKISNLQTPKTSYSSSINPFNVRIRLKIRKGNMKYLIEKNRKHVKAGVALEW